MTIKLLTLKVVQSHIIIKVLGSTIHAKIKSLGPRMTLRVSNLIVFDL
jgi:hypothetical protein